MNLVFKFNLATNRKNGLFSIDILDKDSLNQAKSYSDFAFDILLVIEYFDKIIQGESFSDYTKVSFYTELSDQFEHAQQFWNYFIFILINVSI